jgi:hypothetical protein
MLRVMHKNAQLPNILATMAERADLSDFERGVSKGGVYMRSQPD